MLFEYKGEHYLFQGTIINKTDDSIMVSYTPLNGADRGKTFVRTEGDFTAKFTRVG